MGRETPMHLWQLDLVGVFSLADGRGCKALTGIAGHSRFVVVARIPSQTSGANVCEAFNEATAR